jgi:hypothetical protein
MSENIPAELDALQMYFGDDFPVSAAITIHQPSMGDVIDIGEETYYSTVFALTAISSDMKSCLWDMGIDWTKFSDLEMFYMLATGMPKENTAVFFGDLDFSAFKLYRRGDGDLFMCDPETETVIDSYVYHKISSYICRLHNIKKKPELPGNLGTKKILIDEDRQKRKFKNEKGFKTQLMPLISAMVNSPGFKYALNDVRDLKIFAFMDSVMRIQTIKSVDQLTEAYYSGNIDTKKFDVKKLNWLGDLSK